MGIIFMCRSQCRPIKQQQQQELSEHGKGLRPTFSVVPTSNACRRRVQRRSLGAPNYKEQKKVGSSHRAPNYKEQKKVGCSLRAPNYKPELKKVGCSHRAPNYKEQKKVGCSLRAPNYKEQGAGWK
jgi:hypothetical protein